MDLSLFKNYGKNTPELTLVGISTNVRVVNVHDGDTISVIIPLFNTFYKYNIRIYDLDTPEIHNTNLILKKIAEKGKQRILELIGCIDNDLEDNIYGAYIECKEYDKYGRLLANVYTLDKHESISDILIKEKLGYHYDGNRKLTPEQQILLLT